MEDLQKIYDETIAEIWELEQEIPLVEDVLNDIVGPIEYPNSEVIYHAGLTSRLDYLNNDVLIPLLNEAERLDIVFV